MSSHRARLCGCILVLAGFLVVSPAVSHATAHVAQASHARGAPPTAWVAHPPFHVAPYKSAGKHPATGGVTNPNPQGYIPCDLSNAYYLGSVTGTGSGQLIAIVDAYAQPNIASDLATFDTTFGLAPPPSFRIYQQAGTRKNQGWGLEESLDVEWAHAIAPGASLALIEAASASLSNLLNAVHYAVSTLHASVVSMSWGGSEFSGESSYDSFFPTSSGIMFTASSGDNGTGVIWPAASPNVVSVGGTSLSSAATGDTTATHTTCGSGSGANSNDETAWSGSGGGLSAYEPFPAYQSGFNTFSSTRRGTPDVAWDGDPNTGVAVYDSYGYQGQSGWFQVGGTSVGAPSWAAVFAIADQQRAASGKALLSIASGDATAPEYLVDGSSFTDITTGSNGSCGTDCSAQVGYDLVTGRGSPVGNHLLSTATTIGSLISQ